MAGGVVVGVHHAETSDPAVRWAVEESRLRGLRLTLVHAWNEPLDVAIALEDLPGYDGPAESRAEHGRAAAVLLAHPADMIVLGAHSPHVTHATRLVLHHATCPVVVVPDDAAPSPSTAGRVVVGVKPHEASRMPLRWAVEAAAIRHAQVVVVHAWQVHPHSAWDVFHPAVAAVRQEERLRDELQAWLRAEIGDAGGVEVRTPHGAPLDVLLAIARPGDLLVLGRSGHQGLGRLLHAAVSQDAAGLAGCPVAVVPDLGPGAGDRVSV